MAYAQELMGQKKAKDNVYKELGYLQKSLPGEEDFDNYLRNEYSYSLDFEC